ncbi:hypothetical protein CANARDRAFT_28636 [[Candida] arabinofermentans NRRL YB-2248]|uniref:Phosphatase PP2A regulatory subunit A/Splicing factor 3B subunit 1-like HEAT repeat domain-containing protein n=1 Tax=[Candida] arabinofermentans NRRL YB-2248 TaxID=983967 RepID=A0A1E4SZF7_9ASCO|nr:hypothetical protein CANARDRAFT_28636 [[Candida] arabinofermentans NRRL YB-2248]
MPSHNKLIPLDQVDKPTNVKLTGTFSMPKQYEISDDEIEAHKDQLSLKSDSKRLISRESQYQKRKYESLQKLDDGERDLSYKEAMERRNREKEMERQLNEEREQQPEQSDTVATTQPRKRKRRWDVRNDEATEEVAASKTQDEVNDNNKQPSSETSYAIVDGIPLTDEILDMLLPSGFTKLTPPEDYTHTHNIPPDNTKAITTEKTDGYMIPESVDAVTSKQLTFNNPQLIHEVPGLRDLVYFKDSDMRIFGKLITTRGIKNTELSIDELKERKCMKLILKIKNGQPNKRKQSLRSLADNARYFGPNLIFNIILPLLLDKSLEDQERHLLVKVIGRVLFKLDDLIRPYTHKILIVIMPLLIDEDLYTRLEGREIISNLSKATGLAHMISTLRPDIDHSDDYVRNTVARTFAVVASSLGIQSLLPFLKAVCNSKKSWMARHTGVKIISNIAILMGSSILPHLNGLISCLTKLINDENLYVRSMTAMAITSLAQASAPYGFESFEKIIEPLWESLKKHRGKHLAAFLTSIGSIIPLMDEEYGNYYTNEVFKILKREFNSPDDDMKKAILNIIKQCCSLDSIDKKFITDDLLEEFFTNFWNRRVALDNKINKMCVEASYSLSLKIGTNPILDHVVIPMKDESEAYRKMAVETASKVIVHLGSYSIDDRTVNRLLDGLLYSFQNQTNNNDSSSSIFLEGFGNIMISLGVRVKPHLMSIVSAILYRLKNQSPEVRQQAADLISKICPVLKICDEDEMIIRLGTILYESLGEVYPEVLGSILGALKSVIANCNNIESLNPPISQLLATLTPILRNRHEKVQEMTINLIGDIASSAKEYINHREWVRISFELLEMLKAYKRQIRQSANRTFGLIAKAIGPADVLVTLLNNLRVQERQLRVCTAVAIGIVADICSPYTILPALMNEYRFPDKNVQNGILKSMSFMFEYIGDVSSDYVYSVIPLLQDALTDRDLVHRQTAASVVRQLAIGCFGLGYEDAFIHFLNLIIPNVFETSPHVISRILESIESCGLVIGTGLMLNYIWSGLFHPARMVRSVYWKMYNDMYVYGVDSMIPYYPRFEAIGDEVKNEEPKLCLDKNDYSISELDLWI